MENECNCPDEKCGWVVYEKEGHTHPTWNVSRQDLISDRKKLFEFMWQSQQADILFAIKTLVEYANDIAIEYGPNMDETYEEMEAKLLSAPRRLARVFNLDESNIVIDKP